MLLSSFLGISICHSHAAFHIASAYLINRGQKVKREGHQANQCCNGTLSAQRNET